MKTRILLLLLFILPLHLYSQNITNTLGAGGVFTIKDASSDYLTLIQSTGQVNISKTLRLDNTTSSSIGIIIKGTERFIHNYGSFNTFMGVNSGNLSMTGANNTGVGRRSLYSNTTGNDNTAIGYNSLYYNTGTANTAVGSSSLYSNITGNGNTAVGYNSLYYNEGNSNTAVGSWSLNGNSSGNHNTATGYYALHMNLGSGNTANGSAALYYNIGGTYNTATGHNALHNNEYGHQNTANGKDALYSNTTGTGNTAIGYIALYSNDVGNGNTAIGDGALKYNTNGEGNTAIGQAAGFNITTGYNLTCLGYDAWATSGSATNQITLGNNEITSLRCNVTTITALSDARDKKNIKDLGLGIDFLMKLKPRIYNWDKREWYENNISDGSKMKEEPTAGFIAQELDEVQTSENAEWLNLVLKDNPDKWEATPGNLLPIMVKAIQELKAENEQLNNKLTELAEIKEQIAEIENLKAELKEQIEILKASNNGEKFNFSFINNERIEK